VTARDPLAFLEDMLRAGEDIAEAVSGVGQEAFAADKLRHKAVVRDLEVLGEAASRLPASMRARAPDVPWPRVIGMRNKLIHGYFGMDLDIVHRAATVEVPALLPKLRALLVLLERDRRSSDDV
jgi:uncharacterized protein with HEPN domain